MPTYKPRDLTKALIKARDLVATEGVWVQGSWGVKEDGTELDLRGVRDCGPNDKPCKVCAVGALGVAIPFPTIHSDGGRDDTMFEDAATLVSNMAIKVAVDLENDELLKVMPTCNDEVEDDDYHIISLNDWTAYTPEQRLELERLRETERYAELEATHTVYRAEAVKRTQELTVEAFNRAIVAAQKLEDEHLGT